MKPFMSTVTNKIDAKGRVSFPASIRNVVKEAGFNSVVCFPSFTHKAIEGCAMSQIERFSGIIDQLDPFSDERDALAEFILAEAEELTFDKEGRVKLPESFLAHAGISGAVEFVGLGWKFQLWDPATREATREQRRTLARDHRSMLKELWSKPNGAGESDGA